MLLKVVSLARDVACYFDSVIGVAVLTAVHTPLFCGEDVFVARFLRELYPF